MTEYTAIDQEVDAAEATIWDVASTLWGDAELGYKEFRSSAYVSETLEQHGFAIGERGVGGIDTSWVATWGAGSPVLGILVEFDALPSLGNDTVPTQTPAPSGNPNGHGCGHNLIASTSVGGALALKSHMEQRDISGTIRVVGCPAEEQLNGKNYMAADGAFDGLDVCLHNHPMSESSVWNFHSAASIDLWVEWRGVTAHAGAAPWEGRSALHAAEIFLVAANMMREQMVPPARLHYQILDGGQAVNVIPDYAKVLIRYRGPSAENLLAHKSWIEDMARGAALCTQTEETVTNLGGIYSCLPNDVLAKRMHQHVTRYFPLSWTDAEQEFAKSIQREMGKAEDGMAVDVQPIPTGIQIGGSSDVGDVSWQVPTMGVLYSSWPRHIPPHQWGCTASNGTSIGRRATHHAAKVMAATGLDLLTDPDLLQAVRDDFVKHLDGQTYTSLNDFDKNPLGELDNAERHDYECALHAALEHFGISEHEPQRA